MIKINKDRVFLLIAWVFLFTTLVGVYKTVYAQVDGEQCSAMFPCSPPLERLVAECDPRDNDLVWQPQVKVCHSGTCRWMDDGPYQVTCGIPDSCKTGACFAPPPGEPGDPGGGDDDDDEEEEEQTLRVLKNGTGAGTVTSSPSGINCGSTCTTTSEDTRRWTLTASPASGSTFTRWSIDQYSYNTTCLQPSGKNDCAEWATANTCGTLSSCRIDVNKDSSRTVTATFSVIPPPTITGTLTPSPLSGEVGQVFAFEARLTSRPSAVNPTTYTNPRCRRGFLGLTTFAPVTGSYSGPSSRTFTCVYTSPSISSPTFSNVQGAWMTIRQGVASTTVGATVNVREALPPPPPPTLSVQLTGATGGIINQVLNFTASASGTPAGTTYYTPNCGGGTLSNQSGPTDNTFSCQYGSTGSKDVTVVATRGTLDASATRTVTISEPTISGVDVEVDPQWIPRGGFTTVSWTTDPSNPGVSTVCSVNSDMPVSYSIRSSMLVDDIDEATEFIVRCENNIPSSAQGSAIVYILPSYSEF